jgi:hypothetical protein
VFTFFGILYTVNAFNAVMPPMTPVLYALGGVYGLAAFSVVAGYFWGRWYSLGVGLFGVILFALGLWKEGPEPMILFTGGLHVAATLSLWGEGMASSFDGKTAWREKLHMDENAVQRLGRSVIRAGVSLPIVLIYALAPKQPASMVIGLAAVALAGLGLRGLVQMRTWGILALAVSGAAITTLGIEHTSLYGTLGGSLLLFAAAPFARPMLRLIRA